jgi:Phosphotransferase enzyme family
MTLAHDPAVPRRDELLDGQAVARALGAGGCSRTYAKYRVGESLRVVHRTDAGSYVAGRSFADVATAYARAARPGVVCAPELDAVLWQFPSDRRIAALPLIAEPSAALDRLLGRRCAGTRLVAYAAERSATAACFDAGGRVIAFAKVHAGDGAARERRATEAVRAALGAGDAQLRVPHVIGGDEAAFGGDRAADGRDDSAHRGDHAADGRGAALGGGAALALEALPGRRLDALPGSERERGLERLGSALATLHGLRPPEGTRFGRYAPDRLARAVGTIATARPADGPAAAELLAALLARRADAAGPDVCLHGDANLRNALLDGDRVALIDLEDVAAGPAAVDVGHVLAGLLCERAAGALPAASEPPLARALLRGYAAIAPLPRPETLAWHTAAAILARRALTAVNRVREPDLRRIGAFLRAARALVR